jgi:hypothetical protein
MGQAYRAPFDNYRRTLGIGDHAILRLRERLDKSSMVNAVHRTHEDLCNEVDAACIDAIQRGDYESFADNKHQQVRVVRLQALPTTESLYAIIKKNDQRNGRYGNFEHLVLTLYTEQMVKEKKAHGKWTDPDGDSGLPVAHVRQTGVISANRSDTKINNLGAKLQSALDLASMVGQPLAVGAKAPLPAPAPPPRTRVANAEVAPVKPAPPVPTPPPPPPVANATDMRLVTYRHIEGEDGYQHLGHGQQVEYQAGELRQRLAELHADKTIDHSTIRIWREVKAKARVTVEYDIED